MLRRGLKGKQLLSSESDITVWVVLFLKLIQGEICDKQGCIPCRKKQLSHKASGVRLMKYIFIKGIHFTITLNSYVSLTLKILYNIRIFHIKTAFMQTYYGPCREKA